MFDWLEKMCLKYPEAAENIQILDDYNMTSVVKFPSKYWYFSQVSVKADFYPTIKIGCIHSPHVHMIKVLHSVTK